MRTDEELKQIAQDFYAQKIITSLQVPDDMLTSVFMVLGMMNEKVIKEMVKDDITMVFEYINKAEPMSVNGFPIFMSCQMLTREEHIKVRDYFQKIKEAVEAI